MPARTPRSPSYRLHKPTGQAVVRLNGRDCYLGKHGSKVSRNRYDELISRWLANGRRLPEPNVEPITVNELLIRYYRFCEKHYGQRRTVAKRLSVVRCALGPVRRLFGTTSAASFGPRSLLLVREQFLAQGLARKTINDNVQVIKRMFKWAVREEIVPPSVHHGLSAVDGLRAGETQAAEPRNILPVPDDHVDAVLPHVLRPVRAMIELQRLTGMRPGEVTIMRTVDLDMTGSLWLYRPQHHKSEHHSLDREVYLGPHSQEVIRPFLRPNLGEYIFRPDEAEVERDAERRRRRKTRLWPSHVRSQQRKRRRTPKRTPNDHYSVGTYAQAVRRGCARAGVSRWTPHQLRHNYVTTARKEYGIEATRILLGHRSAVTTELYAEADRMKAQEIVTKIG